MIIVKVMGGLGNQMFQYALYKGLLEKGKEVKLDLRAYKMCKFHNGYELNKIFNLMPNIASEKECKKLSNDRYSLYYKIERKIFGQKKRDRKCTHMVQNEFLEKNSYSYIEEIFEMDNVYLDGFWQHEKYFKNIRQNLLEDFFFNVELNEENQMILSEIKQVNSVSVHVRRGDYINTDFEHCGKEYYNKAINYINKHVPNPKFFIYSDDINWCRSNLDIEDCIFVNNNKGESSFIDMFLMSKCKNNIIANSSFSWWGAWLNQNEKKIVIVPYVWNNNQEVIRDGLWIDNWLKIEF